MAIHEPLTETEVYEDSVPECIRRNRLNTPYFPGISRGVLACVIVACAVYVLTSFNRLNHTDLWGHLNFGRWMIEHQQLPSSDPFGLSGEQVRAVNIPWLSQLAGVWVYRQWGGEGLILAHALLVLTSCVVLMFATYRKGASPPWVALAGLSMFVLALPIVGTIRPQLVGMLGFSLTLLACTYASDKRHPVVWIFATYLIWANAHGSFVVGGLVLTLHALGQTIAQWRSIGTARTGRLLRIWLVPIAAFSGACVNPLGIQLIWSVARFGSHDALGNISEWRSLSLLSLSGILFYSSALMGLIVYQLSPRKSTWVDLALLGLFGIMTVSSMRMLVWWAYLWPWIVIPWASAAWSTRRAAHRTAKDAEADEGDPKMRAAIAMAFVFMAVLVAPPSQGLLSDRPRGIGPLTSSETPHYVADELERLNLRGNLFAPMDWADYLIWRTHGAVRPLVYSHVHLAVPQAWKDYQAIAMGDPAWRKLAEKNQLRYVIASRQRNPGLARQIHAAAQTNRVRIVYQDQKTVLAELLTLEKPST